MWVDQACINQLDLGERDKQVMLVRDIFTKSKKVYVWLGERAEAYAKAFAFLPKLLNTIECQLDIRCRNIDRIMRKRKRWPDLPDNTTSPKEIIHSLANLFENASFTRSWTFQEIICAPFVEMFAGGICITYATVFNYACVYGPGWYRDKLARRRSLKAYRMTWQVITVALYKMGHDENKIMFTLAVDTRAREATDSRDKLYSLLGVALPVGAVDFTPNYGLKTAMVYRDFAAFTMKGSNNLTILEPVVAV